MEADEKSQESRMERSSLVLRGSEGEPFSILSSLGEIKVPWPHWLSFS